ncbi:MAG: DEAD/DEAH box helicase [Promethearchaeota archaeon]
MKAQIRVRYRGDDIVLIGAFNLDDQLKNFPHIIEDKFIRIKPIHFFEIYQILKEKFEVKVEFNLIKRYKGKFDIKYKLRDYQQEAITSWVKNQYKGIVIFPTGAGKTHVGLEAIHLMRVNSLIVVPTIDLLNQWLKNLQLLGLKEEDSGQFGAGKKEFKPIVVSTYQSASLYPRKLRNHYSLIIYDECHHLNSPTYRIIAEGFIAPYRLGLTATLEPVDESFNDLIDLIGPICVRKSPQKMRERGVIANYELKQIPIEMDPEIEKEYGENMKIFTNYMVSRNLMHGGGYKKLIFRSTINKAARRAFIAHKKARLLAFNSIAKIDIIESLLKKHENEKIIIFSESIPFVEKLARSFLIPALTNKTSIKERNFILNGFRTGKISCISTGKVLDEGIDVADASIGIVVSGSAQKRQFIQRLGRILRTNPNKERAILYELISQKTSEVRVSRDRRTKIG